MVAGNWMNNDGLYLQFGTSKAVPTTMGDFLMPGEWRDIEFTCNLATGNPLATAGTYIMGNTTFLPTGVFIESVNVSVETAAAGGTSLSIGTMRADRTTGISATNLSTATTQTAFRLVVLLLEPRSRSPMALRILLPLQLARIRQAL